MQIQFAAAAGGFHEARALYRVVRQAQELDPADSDEIQLLDTLRDCCEAHFMQPEFVELNEQFRPAGAYAVPPVAESGWWHSLFGPSRRELMLSRQRSEALARAERAERSSFESLAETARVARERDAALERIRELEEQLAAAAEKMP